MENAPTVMSQHRKHVEDLKTNCGHREEINEDKLRDVARRLREGLRRWLAAAHHVLRDTALADVDAAVQATRGECRVHDSRILLRHPANQVASLADNRGASRLSPSNLPSPKHFERDRLFLGVVPRTFHGYRNL